jgi:pimeloyl-ACP methyl ester carboxylesterase
MHETVAADATPGRPGGADVVFLHGLGSQRGGEKALHLERWCANRGHGCIRFDFRGHGDSDGAIVDMTLSRLLADLRAVLAWRRREFPAARRTVLVGSSLGGLVSAWYAALHPGRIDGLLLLAPAFRLVERYLERLGAAGAERWRTVGVHRFEGSWFDFELSHEIVRDAARYPHAELVARTRGPVRILHGDRDDTVPIDSSVEFAAALGPEIVRLGRIEGGDHRLTDHRDRMIDELRLLLEEPEKPLCDQ